MGMMRRLFPNYFDGCESASSVGNGCLARFVLVVAFWLIVAGGVAALIMGVLR